LIVQYAIDRSETYTWKKYSWLSTRFNIILWRIMIKISSEYRQSYDSLRYTA